MMTVGARGWAHVRRALAAEHARAAQPFRVEHSAFLPAALEIVERPVSPTARLTAHVLVAGLVAALLWLALGRVDVVASATGRLVPAGSVQLIQPAQPGIVRAILVHENQRVRAGQPLVELDPTQSAADAVQADRALEVAELDAARARAVLSALDGRGLAFVAPPGTPPPTVAIQRALAQAELDDIRGNASVHAHDRASAVAALAEARSQAAKLTETLPLIDQEIAANETLLARGFVSRLRVLEMRRQRLAAARDRDTARETGRRAAAQIGSASGSLTQARAEARARILDRLAKAEAETQARREERTKAQQRTRLQRLASPVDGIVEQMAVHTVGGIVETARPIMTVVPVDGVLVGEVRLANRDMGFVRPGQAVALKVDAFPFTRYGTVPGRVESIASDAVEDEALGLVYIARIAVPRRMPARGGRTIALSPGMTVTADIRTGRRTLLGYLVSPIDAVRQEAGRER